MNYRYATVLAEKSLSTAGTETIDIRLKDVISRLEIGYHPTLGDPAMLAALATPITKIELIDGSDVLHSLNGRENQALCIYDRRVPTMNHAELIHRADLYATMGIDFGRYLYDPELAFDPTKFRNPQLKITHDSTLLSANTDTHSIEVFAHVFDEKVVSPIGFLMSKEHYAYTPANENVYEYIDMPLDYPIRQMLIRGHKDAQDPHDVVDYLKLSEDNDKRIPIDVELEAYIRRMKGVWAQVHEVFAKYFPGDDTYVFYVTPTDHMTAGCGMGGTFNNPCVWTSYIKGGYFRSRIAAAVMVVGTVTGYLPHHCIQFPFGLQDDLDDWYNVTKLGSLRLRLYSAAQYENSLISVILQQLRRY